MGAITVFINPTVCTEGIDAEVERRMQTESHESIPAVFNTTKANENVHTKRSAYSMRSRVIILGWRATK